MKRFILHAHGKKFTISADSMSGDFESSAILFTAKVPLNPSDEYRKSETIFISSPHGYAYSEDAEFIVEPTT